MADVKKYKRMIDKKKINDDFIIDFTTSINNSEMLFIKGMVQDIFPEVLDMTESEICKWCKDRDIYYDGDLCRYIAEYNSKNDTGEFNWLQI